MKLVLLCMGIILFAVWFEERSYQSVHDKVKRRRANGDTSCGAEKTWYGWRIRKTLDE